MIEHIYWLGWMRLSGCHIAEIKVVEGKSVVEDAERQSVHVKKYEI